MLKKKNKFKNVYFISQALSESYGALNKTAVSVSPSVCTHKGMPKCLWVLIEFDTGAFLYRIY
jgi:hypothetical protein